MVKSMKSKKNTKSKKKNIDNLNIENKEIKKIESIKDTLNKFKTKLIDKFDDYIMGISLLPPSEKHKEKINNLILINDTDSKKDKEELKEKIEKITKEIASKIDKNLNQEILLINELWQDCYDSKHDNLQKIALSAPIYDKGMLAAIKISEIHKTMVLKKFEKYIVSYVLAGSLVQGRATPESDIDVFIVIDDTDIKKMTRIELKDKLRAIIIGMGAEAGQMTGITNKLNIQVYILTDFWDSIKEANPIIFTFLRDGIPFFDRGIFMPWKQLLKMGKVKPSRESIDMFRHSGAQIIERIGNKANEIGSEDLFYATLTPTQAAIMLYGLPPPTPKETPEVLEQIFVKKEKILEKEYVKILKTNIQVRKDIEHGKIKKIPFSKLSQMIEDSKKYLERLNKLFEEIEERKQSESIKYIFENTKTMIRDILRLLGIFELNDQKILKTFKEANIKEGLINETNLELIIKIFDAKNKYDNNKLLKVEIAELQKNSITIFRQLVEVIERKRNNELKKSKIKIKHGDKFGEVIIIGSDVFIIEDLSKNNKEIQRAKLDKKNKFKQIVKSSYEELEKVLMSTDSPQKTFLKQNIFDNLKEIFGKEVEILVNY